MVYLELIKERLNMKTKMISILSILIISLVLCVAFRMTMQPVAFDEILAKEPAVLLDDEIPEKNNGDFIDPETDMYNYDITSYQDLWDSADIVVTGTIVEHEQLGKTVNSKIEIKDVLKGNVVDTSVYVFEPYYIRSYGRNYDCVAKHNYVPMQLGKEYTLFLHLEDVYKNGNQYNLVSDLYGKYPNKSDISLKIYEDEKERDFNDYMSYDCIIYVTEENKVNREVLDIYQSRYKEFFNYLVMQ